MLAQLCENLVLNTHGLILPGMCPVLALPVPALPFLLISKTMALLWWFRFSLIY